MQHAAAVAAGLRALLAEMPRLVPDRTARRVIEAELGRLLARVSPPRPVVVFEPIGAGWLLGDARTAKVHTPPPQGQRGMRVAYAAFRGRSLAAECSDPVRADATRHALIRARRWVARVCDCPPLVDAMKNIRVLVPAGVLYVDTGAVAIDTGSDSSVSSATPSAFRDVASTMALVASRTSTP